MALRRVLMMLVLIGSGFQALSQEGYRVIFAGGRTYLSEENRFGQLVSGQRISKDSRLELVGNSMVVIMDDWGRLSSFTLGGKYDLKNLNMAMGSDSSTFIKSVWDAYYKVFDQPVSVEEELLRSASNYGSFELSIPSSGQMYGHRQVLEWFSKGSMAYKAHLINKFGEVFKTVEVNEASLALDFFDKELVWKPEISIQLSTADGKQQTPVYTLHKLSPPDYEDMDRLLKKHLSGDQFEIILTRVAFFENQWLFADAQTTLIDLRNRYGDMMDAFWQAYLLRNGFYSMSRR